MRSELTFGVKPSRGSAPVTTFSSYVKRIPLGMVEFSWLTVKALTAIVLYTEYGAIFLSCIRCVAVWAKLQW